AGNEVVGVSAHHARLPQGAVGLTADLLDADLTARTILAQRPEVIFHLAAQAYVPQAIADPGQTLLNNSLAQLNVLEAARRLEPAPVILVAGSSEVYGTVPPERLPVTEDQPFRPSNPYAVSKVTQDMLGLQYFLSYGLPVVRARPFNHIGPGQSDRFAVASFARQIAEAETGRGQPLLLVGNLGARRDFLDVRDVVRAYGVMARREYAGEVFNVASGVARSVQDLLDALLARATVPIEVRQDPARMRPSEAPLIVGDASKLAAATGWRPEIPLCRSLQNTLDEWRARMGA
ncbi:MAG TPA: GDP-mannose 4,6-dehydratase, partial [Chloroflexota bacterium]|nr:GDP-mannose 4,6-dehydratase [Chloroflexota bacterium]